MEFITVEVSQNLEFDKYVNTEITTQQIPVFKSNRKFGTKYLTRNQLPKTVEGKTNKQSTKYLN